MKTKPLFIIALFFTALFNSSFASELQKKGGGNAFEQGTIAISAGYGFPNWVSLAFKTYDSYTGYKASGIGPAHLKFEYGVSDKIGIGLSLNYVQYKVSWPEYDPFGVGSSIYQEGYTGSSLSALVRMNLHFATSDKLDPYWGIGVGYRSYNFKYFNDNPFYVTDPLDEFKALVPVGFETTIGMRYYFTNNIGAYLEMGMAKSLIQGGLAVKF